MTSNDNGLNVGSELGHSKPLVTISEASSIARGLAVPAGNDHPLAPIPPLTVQTSDRLSRPPEQVSSSSASNPADPSTNLSSALSTPPRNIDSGGTISAPPALATPPTNSAPQVLSSTSKVVPATVSPSKSLDSAANAFLSEKSYRTHTMGLPPILRPAPLPREEGIHRLRTLVARRAWGDVLKIATAMLNSNGNNQSPRHADVYASLVMLPLNAQQVDASNVDPQIRNETVEVMALQCHAWLKLRRYTDLATEIERWNFLAQNDATAQSPSWMSWSLHVLAGQMQQYTEETTSRSSDVLFELRERMPKEDALWLVGVDGALANLFLRKSQWRLALGSLDRILELVPAATKQYLQQPHIVQRLRMMDSQSPSMESLDCIVMKDLEQILTVAHKCEILSRQGRTLLQAGALSQVAKVFAFARELWDDMTKMITLSPAFSRIFRTIRLIPVQLEMNDGLLYFSEGNFDRAKDCFSRAVDMVRSKDADMHGNVPLCQISFDVEDWVGPAVAATESPTVIYTECINNMALCCLYSCRMNEAVELLEGLIREDPTTYLTERVAFNLCTLYELGADSATSARKKRVLQLIAKRFFLHDVGPENFRVA